MPDILSWAVRTTEDLGRRVFQVEGPDRQKSGGRQEGL